MDDFEILRDMLKDSATVTLDDHDGRYSARLEEAEEGYTVTLAGLPADSVIIKVDKFPEPGALFRGARGECRRADYVVIADTGTKKVMVFIEIKATKAAPKEIVEQLTGAQCAVVYCREIGRAFWQEKSFLDGYAYRFVSIGHISLPKRKTRISKDAGRHDTPARMMKIDWPHRLQFNHIAGVK